jgi:hypothetical protein
MRLKHHLRLCPGVKSAQVYDLSSAQTAWTLPLYIAEQYPQWSYKKYTLPIDIKKGSNKRRALLTLLFVLCSFLFVPSLFAVDVGLVLDQNAEYSGSDNDTAFTYKGIAIPRITGLIGDNGDFYFSGGFSYKNNPWGYVPELLRTDLSWRSGNSEITIGRMEYDDPIGYIASGLFDGARFSQNTDFGEFSIGAWYTGFLYKKRANVEMTEKEYKANNTAIEYKDYKNFFNTYFATRRVLAAVDWEHKGLLDRAIARLSLLGQFDLTDEKINSQYLAGKVIIPFGGFSFDLGGCFELIEANKKIGSTFAAEAAFGWRNPVHYLSLDAKYTSGESDTLAAFLPLTTNTKGQILKPKLSAITMISMNYTARLHEVFSVGLYPAYFMLNDSESIKKDKRMLGGEIFGAFYWSPAPDIGINLGGGAFLASLGNVAPDEKTYWRVELNVVLSLF